MGSFVFVCYIYCMVLRYSHIITSSDCFQCALDMKLQNMNHLYFISLSMQDSNSLMDLLTFKAVEEKVKKRVEKKARTFGQNITLEDNATAGDSECKVDPKVLSKLYDQWVMPLTKDVEVEYLLRRLY